MTSRGFFAQRYALMGWKYADAKPRQAIRVNTANAKELEVLKRLEARGIELEKIPFLENGYWVRKAKVSVGATTEYLLGLYSIQEAAAQIPVTLFTDLKDKLVLDACAAPGGKTVQLADLMRNTGMIVALDIEKGRLAALANQLERCRVQNTVVYQLDARRASKLSLRFDRVLLDVPCSGNFATDREWFHRRTLEDVERNAELQREILAEAVRVLKDDGELVYSTCSLEPEEDELNIDWAAKTLEVEPVKIDCFGGIGLTDVFGKKLNCLVANCRRIWPEQTQGFFVCKLRKRV